MLASLTASLDGLFWFGAMLIPLVFLQRFLHRELQAVLYMLTRHEAVTQGLFALLFFPGVFLHEVSHYVVARVLGVRTGRLSLLPQALDDGRLRLGYVEMAASDPVRATLIGAAPLFSGLLALAWIGGRHLYLFPLWAMLREGQYSLFFRGLRLLPGVADFWLWFYLAFVISSMMLPSASDRYAWRTFGLLLLALLAVAVLAGGGDWLLLYLAPPFNTFLRTLAILLFLSVALHLALAFPIAALRWALSRLTGMRFQ